jgi:transcriptional regulator with XRE-family HTH domain
MELNQVKALLGAKIRTLRKAKRLSQELLAHKAGLKESYISELENGKVNTTIETLLKIALVLEVQMREFFEWE